MAANGFRAILSMSLKDLVRLLATMLLQYSGHELREIMSWLDLVCSCRVVARSPI